MDAARLSDAEALLRRAGEVSERARLRSVRRARSLLSRANRLVLAQLDDQVSVAERTLASYDGLPSDCAPMEVFGIAHSETAHTQFLAWLLDPGGRHGLGDAMVRWLLAASSRRSAVRLAGQSDPVRALVRAECPLGGATPDMVVVVPGHVAVLELKVWDVEHSVSWHDPETGRQRRQRQSAAYRMMMQSPQLRAAALAAVGPEASMLPGRRPTILSYFVRPSGRPKSPDEPETTNLNWLHVERALARSLRRAPANPAARTVLQAFRSNLLVHTGASTSPVEALERIRRVVDLTNLRLSYPMDTYLTLRNDLAHLRGDERA